MSGQATELQEIENMRVAMGVSQSALCRRADVHAVTYMKMLNGQTKAPRSRTLSRLSRAIDFFAADTANF